MKLVIVESPAKAETIRGYLGSNYQVVATMGHLADLPKHRIGVDVRNAFLPEYELLSGKKKVLDRIVNSAKQADEIFIATDPDREGEFIGWFLSQKLSRLSVPIKRVRFSEISKEKIISSMQHPGEIRSALVAAQQARRIVDRLLGYRISPLLWDKIGKGLSAGRVQSVALHWICERENEIRDFVQEVYARLFLDIEIEGIRYRFWEEEKEERVSVPEAEALLTSWKSAIAEEPLKILDIIRKKRKRNPPPPFTTATLQREAIQTLGFSASKTMKLAQMLYEGIPLKGGKKEGLITYMRTDSTRISEEARAKTLSIANRMYPDSTSGKTSSYRKKGKHSQDAHEAIRPVDPNRIPENLIDLMGNDLWKLYRLIWNRTLISVMDPEEFTEFSALGTWQSRRWVYRWKYVSSEGFTAFQSGKRDLAPSLPLQKGDSCTVDEFGFEERRTEPPQRYTEATIIAKLEKTGVGRPSTYATILQTLAARKYTQVKQRQLFPTALGQTVDEFLFGFFPELLSESYTAQMEKELDMVEREEFQEKDLLASYYKTLMDAIKDSKDQKVVRARTKKIICPACHKGTLEGKLTKKKKVYYICSEYPHCDFVTYEKPEDWDGKTK